MVRRPLRLGSGADVEPIRVGERGARNFDGDVFLGTLQAGTDKNA